VECCQRDPGWFLPEEVAHAAAHLNLSKEEFIKKFCIEHVIDDVTVISPAAKLKKTECVFLSKKGLCEIHEVKPFECKKVYACKGDRRHQTIRNAIKKMWMK
jgi:Fe-S-cluster containining protein